ncbi:CCR4-NOT transcription complex subunit 6 [Eufriesea mexicana]|uniref:CCR4-NOT transcription complex subunit 6 n=1 Tax=Eufriesea mexicana TaxID=516756 RepID=A0A310S6C9_9HYME|nr:CCR4-NOT transcription complex subunit 6 [Eufriesea mexicana]
MWSKCKCPYINKTNEIIVLKFVLLPPKKIQAHCQTRQLSGPPAAGKVFIKLVDTVPIVITGIPKRIFTVMCYNVLCDKYATRQMYGYCPSWALDWEYRRKGILDEIRHYAADIISLQEVETDQFYNFFLPELKHDGYDGIFSPKSRAKTMAENDRKYVDGCAIFYRTAKFTLIKEHLVEFNQLAMANAEGSDNMLNRVMPKDNIGLAALLRTKEAAWDNEVNGKIIWGNKIKLQGPYGEVKRKGKHKSRALDGQTRVLKNQL